MNLLCRDDVFGEGLAVIRPSPPSRAVMSANGETSTVLRGVTHGAVDFLIKPVRIEELRNVWQHVVRRRRTGSVRIILPNHTRRQVAWKSVGPFHLQ